MVVSSEDISLSISLPSGGGGGGGQESSEEDEESISTEDKSRLAQVRTGILKLLSVEEEESGDAKDASNANEEEERHMTRESKYVVSGRGNEDDGNFADADDDDDDSLAEEDVSNLLKFSEKHEYEADEKSQPESLVATMPSSKSWTPSEMVTTPGGGSGNCGPGGNPDQDSGIDRETGGRSSTASSAMTQPQQQQRDTKLWTKFQRQVRRYVYYMNYPTGNNKGPSLSIQFVALFSGAALGFVPNTVPQFSFRFGGSTGSLSSSPNSEDPAAAISSGGRSRSGIELYSPEIAQMDSPTEGGFGAQRNDNNQPQSVAILKKHIKVTRLAFVLYL